MHVKFYTHVCWHTGQHAKPWLYCMSKNHLIWLKMIGFFSPFRLLVNTPVCEAVNADAACHLSTASVRDGFCSRESRESRPCSASCCRSSLLPSTHKPVLSLRFVYRTRWGLDTLHSQRRRKKRWDTGKKSSRDTQTRVSVWAPTAQRCGYFWSWKGFTQWVYITGIPLVSALKRNCSSRVAELKQLSVHFRSSINRLYKYDVFLYDLSA